MRELVSSISAADQRILDLQAETAAMRDELHALLVEEPELLGKHANGRLKRSTIVNGYKVGLQAQPDSITLDGRTRGGWGDIRMRMWADEEMRSLGVVYRPPLKNDMNKLRRLTQAQLDKYNLHRVGNPDGLICKPESDQ